MNSTLNSVNRMFRFPLVLVLSVLVLAGCRSNDLFGDEAENVTSIEVIDPNSDELVTTLTDSSFIESLVQELEYANSSSTAAINFPGPDYRLLFLDDDDFIIQEIDYYIEESDYGVVGRYHASGLYLAVTTELPIEESD